MEPSPPPPESDILCECPFLDPELRSVLERVLHVKCVVPSFVCGKSGNTARCLLEENPYTSVATDAIMLNSIAEEELDIVKSATIAEDVICKVMPRCNIGKDINDFRPSDDSEEEDVPSSKLNYVSYELFLKMLDTFIIRPPRIDLPMLGKSSVPLFIGRSLYSNSRHPGITTIYNLVDTKQETIMITKYFRDILPTLSRLVTSLSCASLARESGEGVKDVRLRFVIYQLLQLIAYTHSQGLCIDLSSPHLVTLTENVWVNMGVQCSDRLILAAECVSKIKRHKFQSAGTGSIDELEVALSTAKIKTLLGVDYEGNLPANEIQRPPNYYEPITMQWVNGKISNFEYILAINAAAGRNMLDPAHHPVLPWVTDFTSEFKSGSDVSMLRDLTKSKFRLSKGDCQLESTFEHSNPPHHIPEILSELTYYIYMARRTPMQILKRVVRGYFVANHYPDSMTRMYNWTPDECTPEFYTDITVLESIHQAHGLKDIELPPFTPTPSDFISYHRSVLESDEISCRLHHWIDLTFGCKLIGDEAMKNLNVPLVHALSKKQEYGAIPGLGGHPGFVVLFDRPHPKKHIVAENKPLSNHGHHMHCSDHLGDVNSMLDMAESYGIISTPYPDLSEQDKSFTERNRNKKYLSDGNIRDKSLHLLKFAQTGKFNNLNNNENKFQAEAMKFSTIYGTALEPCYSVPLLPHGSEWMKKMPEDATALGDIDFQTRLIDIHQCELTEEDTHFVNELDILCNASLTSSDVQTKLSPSTVIRLLQSQDMFAVGCLIVEIYTGMPLLSKHDVLSPSFAKIQEKLHKNIMQCHNVIPLNLRRIVNLLTHPHPLYRPSAGEILKHCCAVDDDLVEFSMNVENGSIFFEYCEPALIKPFSTLTRHHILEDYCYFSFPSHFQPVYNFIGRLHIAQDGISKLRILSENLFELGNFSLEGVSLILPHVLDVVSDSTPFQQCFSVCYSNAHKFNIDDLIAYYAKIVNALGDRLGSDDTEKILMPNVTVLLTSLESAELLLHFLKSRHFWIVLLSQAPPKCFLRYFLPLLLTYLVSGTLQATPRATSTMCRSDLLPSRLSASLPVWVTGDKYGEEQCKDWLNSSRKDDLLLIQKESLNVLVMLSLPEALGPGLCARYVLPSLLNLLSNPRFSIAGFGMSIDNADYHKIYDLLCEESPPFSDICNEKVVILSEYNEDNMFVVRGMLGICQRVGELVITTTVLPKLINEVIPQIVEEILNRNTLEKNAKCDMSVENYSSGPFLSSLLEALAALRGLLTMLSTNSIRSFYFESIETGHDGDGSRSCSSVLSLLITLPLPFINPETDFTFSSESDDEGIHVRKMQMLEFRQRHTLFIELTRLITTAASQLNFDTIHSKVLPTVNNFFDKFVHTYCDLDVRCDVMALAFEIGRSLYVPMVQLVGADTFSTAVPAVNPRLEVWLLHTYSDDSETWNLELNALPDTIFPVTMSRQDVADEIVEPEKDKGMFGGFIPEWLSTSPRKPQTEKKIVAPVDKNAEALLNQQWDDAMRGAIAQQEIQRGLLQTPTKKKIAHCLNDSDDDSVLSYSTSNEQNKNIFFADEGSRFTDTNTISKVFCATKFPRNPKTKSVMYYKDEKSFYHSLHSLEVEVEEYDPTERVYYKHQGTAKYGLSLVNHTGNLVNKIQANSFNPSKASTARLSDDNVMTNFKKVLKATIQRSPSTANSDALVSFGMSMEDDEDNFSKAEIMSKKAWLLGGTTDNRIGSQLTGKGGFNSPLAPQPVPENSEVAQYKQPKKTPASISMAAPKVVSDIATVASEMFALNMVNETSWAFDALAYKAGAAGAVNIMLADPTERFLVAGAKDGEMKVWSLMSYPVVELMKYSAHRAGVYSAGFLKSGTHVASCDGTIRIWDIETGMTIADLQRSHSELDVFSHLQVVSPRLGVGSDMSKHGDDQLTTCSGAVLAHYDIRIGYLSTLNPISEWKLYTNYANGNLNDVLTNVSLTCAASNEDYVCVGSTMGTLWVYERRTGRPIHCWVGHDGSAILKIQFLSRHQIITVTERNSFSWILNEAEPRKFFQIKNLPDCSAVMNKNTIVMHSFENCGTSGSAFQDLGSMQKNTHVLYCMAGHKISAGVVSRGGYKSARLGSTKDADSDIRLTRSFFNDYNGVKLTKPRLQISSACLLPLRKMMLLGSSDGLIRAIV